jgi:hypothetical protein
MDFDGHIGGSVPGEDVLGEVGGQIGEQGIGCGLRELVSDG